jgi:anti-anti-sigma factor
MTTPELSIAVTGTPGHVTVAVEGDLDGQTAPRLIERVSTVLRDPPARLSLDLAGIRFFGSGSVATVVGIHKAAGDAGTQLELINVPDLVRRVLDISGLIEVLMIQPRSGGASS